MITKRPKLKAVVVTGIMTTSCVLWIFGLFTSPLTSPSTKAERRYVETYIQSHSPDLDKVRVLAELYWKRYPDVGQDHHYGRNGIMGIYGARNHYDQHGKVEGREWGR